MVPPDSPNSPCAVPRWSRWTNFTRTMTLCQAVVSCQGWKGGAKQAGRKPVWTVIPTSPSANGRRGIPHCFENTQSETARFAPSKVTSFPRKRESTDLDPRFRGGDDGHHFHVGGWAAGPCTLGMTVWRGYAVKPPRPARDAVRAEGERAGKSVVPASPVETG